MKCIVTCSGKGGTGKSCVAAYIGAALAGSGRKTVLVELGADARSLDLILGTPSTAYGAADVIAGGCSPDEATVAVENAPNLYLMTAGTSQIPQSPLAPQGVAALLAALRMQYDFVIVDGADPESFPAEAADTFLLVLTPDTLCVRACTDLAGRLYRRGAGEVRLIINQVPARIIPIEGAEDFDDVINQVGARLLGVIPQSPKLQYCANNAKQLDPDSLTVKVFDNIAGRLMGQRRPLLIR